MIIVLEQIDVLFAHAADFGARRRGSEAGFSVGPRQVDGWPLDIGAIEPFAIIGGDRIADI